jgi:hypothetical protein
MKLSKERRTVMIHLLMAMMLTPVENGIPQRFMLPRDQGTQTTITDKDLRPGKTSGLQDRRRHDACGRPGQEWRTGRMLGEGRPRVQRPRRLT